MTWTVEPILLRGEHRGGWYVENESPDMVFEARNEIEGLILAHILDTAGGAGYADARDGALKVLSARQAPKRKRKGV